MEKKVLNRVLLDASIAVLAGLAIVATLGASGNSLTGDVIQTCGNGKLNSGETCDDGNAGSDDGCSAICKVESGFECKGLPSICKRTCGDGVQKGKEQCDDGNANNSDGCSSVCKLESGFECKTDNKTHLTVCKRTCGDGVKGSSEQCDDKNSQSGDGCSSSCTLEPGFKCATDSKTHLTVCKAICGNGTKQGSEECDDGNTFNGDGCSSLCKTEGSIGTCGNGSLEGNEQCDDENNKNGDGCSACKIDQGYTCNEYGRDCKASSSNGLTFEWTAETSLPASLRESAITTALGKMWVIAGYDAQRAALSDKVYSTSDGKTWSETGKLPYSMYGASAIEWNGELWVVGGITCGSQPTCYLHRTLHSKDGVTWQNGPDVPGSFIIYKHSLFVLGGKLFVSALKIHALDSETSSWKSVGSAYGSSTVTFQGKAWMINGQSVVSSADGATGWSVQSQLPVRLTTEPYVTNPGMLVVHGNYLLAVGNSPDPSATVNQPNCYKTILSSLDGVHWGQSQTSPCWSPLRDETTLSFQNKLWRIGEVFDSGKVFSGKQN